MDPLQKLYDLYEQEMLQDPNPTVGAPEPAQEPAEHPVIAKKKMLDAAIEQGISPQDAYEKVFGDIDTNDPQQKAEVAKVLGRYSRDRSGNVSPEPGSTSIFAIDTQLTKLEDEQDTPEEDEEDLKTPAEYEKKRLDNEEETQYNEDVAYLQKYGRA